MDALLHLRAARGFLPVAPRRSAGLVVLVGALCGCGAPPPPPATPVDVSLTVSGTTVALGDTLTLRGVVANRGPETVRAGAGCSPGIGFFVTDEAADTRDLFANAFFTCDVKDSNAIEAGETDSVTYRWVPTAPGSYELTAALLLTDAPPLTSPVTVVVVTERAPGGDSLASPPGR